MPGTRARRRVGGHAIATACLGAHTRPGRPRKAPHEVDGDGGVGQAVVREVRAGAAAPARRRPVFVAVAAEELVVALVAVEAVGPALALERVALVVAGQLTGGLAW